MPKHQADWVREPLGADEMLRGLLAARPALLKMQQKQLTPAVPLVAAVLALDLEQPLPKHQDLQKQLGISATVYRRQLEVLHRDFLSAIKVDGELLAFGQVACLIYIHTYHSPDCIEFRCQLPLIPRIGERVDLPFLVAVAGNGDKCVDSVSYELADGKMTVHIVLGDFKLSHYVTQLRDQAVFEGLTTHRELRGMSPDELATFLRKLYPV